MEARFERPVSANEQLYLAASRAISSFVGQLVVEGKGIISAEELQAALDHVARHVPGSCLRLSGKRWIADAPGPRVVLLSEYPNFRSQSNLSDFPRDYFRPEHGKTCEVAFAQSGDDCLVVFRALHAVMDGQGVAQWAKAVFSALRGEEMSDATSSLTDDEFVRSTKAPMRHDEPFIPRQAGPRARFKSEAEGFNFDHARRTLRSSVPGIISKLAVGARKLLCSKTEDRFCAMIPVDLRRAAPEARDSTANLTLPLFLPVGANDTWADVSQDLLSRLNEREYIRAGPKDWLYHFMPHGLISWVFRKAWIRQLRQGKYLLSAVISHVGKFEWQDFRSAGFEQRSIYCLPFALPVAPLSFIIIEHPFGTEVLMVKARPLWNEPREVLDKVLEFGGLNADEGAPAVAKTNCVFGLPLRPPRSVPDISTRIAESAQKFADRIAASDDYTRLTYKEFITRRDIVAAAMLETAQKPLAGERIALVMNRSVEAFLCIHACIELNAVFVPIDPAYPEERIRLTLDDCRPALVVHDEERAALANVKSISTRALVNLRPRLGADFSRSVADPAALAYIIYTSGTTGRPKGVAVTRHNLSHYVRSTEAEFFLHDRHRGVALATSLSFDASILSLFTPLLQGCEIKLIRENVMVLAMEQVVDDPDVTFSVMTPSHLQIIVGFGRKPASRWLCLVSGGESLTPELCHRVLELFGPQLALKNVYGPTEATVSVAHHRFDPGLDTGPTVPIGGPIDCAGLYILRDDRTPCSEGEEGEIFIGGYAVTNGYWNDEAMTRERFVPDPFTGKGMMYRSGDRAVYRNGHIFFAGRKDEQVKVNGYRIEPEEIATRMKEYPGVTNAAVLIDESGSRPALVGFFVTAPGAKVIAQEVSSFLARFLPRFMIPSSFCEVAEIPLTLNGKVNRQELLSRARQPSAEATGTMTEIDVGDIWSRFLRVPRSQLALDSNFFDLGGDSILLLETLSEINRVFWDGKRTGDLMGGLREFFVNPQLVQMMRWVESLNAKPPRCARP
jgi:amino acid adenylation domain-containing protein